MLDYKNCQKTALSSSQFGKWQISVMYQFGDIFKIEFRREGENVRVSKHFVNGRTEYQNVLFFRGRWHGDIMIHTRRRSAEQDLDEFLKEVSVLSMIRHENVVLFMGACLEPPNLAVITR